MMRPFWSGQFQLSLVSFGIQLFPATEAKGEIHFHQLSRKTGERIKHLNVTADDQPVDKDDIVKGYEYSKGEYVTIESEDIEQLRIPSRQTFAVEQFVDLAELDLKYFEKPYFVTPDSASQTEAFTVVRKAMQSTGKIALGKIAFGGREHLVAITAPATDDEPGMMAYTLRYAEELRDAAEYFGSIRKTAVDKDQLALAMELIERKAKSFDASSYSDEYETALRAMVDAKIKHTPAPKEKSTAPKSTKVVSLMDALRKSVQADSKPAETKDSSVRATGRKSPGKKLDFPAPPKPGSSRASKAKSTKTNSKHRMA
jgi:DNA end-binding protein Ku